MGKTNQTTPQGLMPPKPADPYDPTRNDAEMRYVRAIRMGNPRGSPLVNDNTMRDIMTNGAPQASRFGAPPAGFTPPEAGAIDPGMTSQGTTMGSAAAVQTPMWTPPAGQMGPMGSRIAESPMNPMSTGGGLSARGVRPIGRSMREAPERRLEQAARQGSIRATEALVGLKQQQGHWNFLDGQNDKNFNQQWAMNQMQQDAADARYQTDRQDRQQFRQEDQAMQQGRDAQQWQQTLQLREMDAANQAARDAQEQRRRSEIQNVPIPGTDLYVPQRDGQSVPGAPLLQMNQEPFKGVPYRAPGPPTLKPVKPEDNTSPWQLYDAPGPLVPHPFIKDMMIPGPTVKRQVHRVTGETRDLIPEGTKRGAAASTAAPAGGDGQKPSWMGWLSEQTK